MYAYYRFKKEIIPQSKLEIFDYEKIDTLFCLSIPLYIKYFY